MQDSRWRPLVTQFAYAQVSIQIFIGFALLGRRTFSQSAARQNYDATIQNLLIHKDTKVLCQGLTGKTVSRHVETRVHMLTCKHRVLST